MDEILIESAFIKNQAHEILFTHKLESTLKNFGIVYVLGSYELDLMIWKDLDISVQVKQIDVKDIFALIRECSIILDPGEVKYTNYDFVPSSHGSQGIYVQFKECHIGSVIWDKIDIIIGTEKQIAIQISRNKYWKDKIIPQNKKPIIKIKREMYTNPLYRKQIQSVDIYSAVINEKIADFSQFKLWCKNKKNIDL